MVAEGEDQERGIGLRGDHAWMPVDGQHKWGPVGGKIKKVAERRTSKKRSLFKVRILYLPFLQNGRTIEY